MIPRKQRPAHKRSQHRGAGQSFILEDVGDGQGFRGNTGSVAAGEARFRDRAGVTGLVMTKLDGTARGGILVAIAARFGMPVHAIGVGEGVDDLQPFDAEEFARAIALS